MFPFPERAVYFLTENHLKQIQNGIDVSVSFTASDRDAFCHRRTFPLSNQVEIALSIIPDAI